MNTSKLFVKTGKESDDIGLVHICGECMSEDEDGGSPTSVLDYRFEHVRETGLYKS